MTNPGGDSSETPASDSSAGSSEPSSGGYEAPPIEQSEPQDAPTMQAPCRFLSSPRRRSSSLLRDTPRRHPGTTSRRAPGTTYHRAINRPPTISNRATRRPATRPRRHIRRRRATRRRCPTAGLPAALPGSVGLRRAAVLRRPVLSPAAATAYGGAPGYPPPSSYPATGYPGGYGGGYGQPQPETNQMAIWSLVSSLVGFLCWLGRPGRASRSVLSP